MSIDELKAELRRLLTLCDGTCAQNRYVLAEITRLAEG